MPMPAAIASLGEAKVTGLPSTRISPSVGVEQPVEHVHQRRLAGAVLAEQAVDLARLDGQVDVVVGRERPEPLGEPLDLQLHRCPSTTIGSVDGR